MFTRFFQRDRSKKTSPVEEFITVVSGLPRSGTSMMMRMLEAGGIPLLTDSLRLPDESNPKGYYEFEQVKQMKSGDNQWISSCRGKAVKIVSPLLQHLPSGHEYRIVLMRRNIGEVLASQREMLARRGEPVDQYGDSIMEELYQKHLTEIGNWLANQPNLKVLYLHYNQILDRPAPPIAQVAQFLQPHILDTARMLSVIESSLYRQRNPQIGQPAQQA